VIDHNYDYEVWNFPVVRFELIEQEDVTEQAAHELVGATGIDYAFNVQATAFKRVRLAYFMVSDGVPAHQLFTRADQRNISLSRHELNYVLELDASGQVLGGEWIAHPTFTWNDSKSLHPDFMWMGTSHRGAGESDDDLGGSGDNPYVAYSKARALLLCANDPQTCAPPDEPNDDVLVEERGQLAQGQTVRFATDPLPAGRYTVTLTEDAAAPGGDVDLYVRAGAEPTMSVWDCRPYRYGSNEICTIELQSEGAIHVLLYGYNSGTNPFVLRVTGEGGDGPDPDVWPGMSESGTVASGEEHRFATGVVAAGSYRFQITGTADADLYVRAGSQPTTQAFDCRPYAGNSNETCRVDLTAPAEIHVMVRGYATTSDYQLVGTRE
jgi:hypothetical protein